MSFRVNYREIYRYMGYKGTEPDAEMRERIDICVRRVLDAAQPRHLTEEAPLSFFGEKGLRLGELCLESVSLRKNMEGCERVIFFAATMGTEVDRVITRASQSGKVSEAFILQAVAAAVTEDYCNKVNSELKEEYGARGLYLRPRFSPGFGDFTTAYQAYILRILRAQRIGLAVTDAMLLTPVKSVTAVIGVSTAPRKL